ncbi:hypothetical protein GH741_00405 [Aquibacillus halophilus]|uniref:MgtC/SapB/SrpB/YhiD N-terminal domain-containing protein n=1 Tax=Aquibacillus halophilus TaxID=930132 RepID=A0A6A8D5Z3_9BACI|nr:hypothetical protein [Aquibacillus halophilus]
MFNPEVWQITEVEISIRLVIALVLGGAIGLERELGSHHAGFRTHILVCLGSALIVLLSIYGFSQFANEPNVRMDPARLAAQVISGIGFLGAGTILRTGKIVSGLTTAASLWVSAAIGLAVGAGFYFAAILSTALVLISLFALSKMEKLLTRRKTPQELLLKMVEGPGHLSGILNKLASTGVEVKKIDIDNLELKTSDELVSDYIQLRLTVKFKKSSSFQDVLEELSLINYIISVKTDFIASSTLKKKKRREKNKDSEIDTTSSL